MTSAISNVRKADNALEERPTKRHKISNTASDVTEVAEREMRAQRPVESSLEVWQQYYEANKSAFRSLDDRDNKLALIIARGKISRQPIVREWATSIYNQWTEADQTKVDALLKPRRPQVILHAKRHLTAKA